MPNKDKINNLLKNTLADGAFFKLNKKLVKKIGRDETLLLQHFIGLQLRSFDDKPFYQQQERIMEETTFTIRDLRNVTKKLKELGLLEVEKRGLPAKNYYYVKTQEVYDIMAENDEEEVLTDPSALDIADPSALDIADPSAQIKINEIEKEKEKYNRESALSQGSKELQRTAGDTEYEKIKKLYEGGSEAVAEYINST